MALEVHLLHLEDQQLLLEVQHRLHLEDLQLPEVQRLLHLEEQLLEVPRLHLEGNLEIVLLPPVLEDVNVVFGTNGRIMIGTPNKRKITCLFLLLEDKLAVRVQRWRKSVAVDVGFAEAVVICFCCALQKLVSKMTLLEA